jgi:hypothetical protein
MTESLKQRLLSIDRFKPYVWKLRLTKDEYDELQTYVKDYNGAINQEYAILAIIYIAEWYKRDYDGNVASPLENISAESLWKESGLGKESGLDTSEYRFVYKAKKTSRWLESIFMLGGLPMSFILHRNDTKLLKALCTLYKDNEASLEDDKDIINNIGRGKAVAFQESIHQYHSLYHFLKTLLLGDAKELYAEEDLAEKSSLANQFIEAVKKAYDEVMREKFRLEWIIDYDPSSPYMRRMVRLWLRPEEMGGLHQYLRFERAGTWKIPSLMQQRILRVSLQFKNGNEVVGNEDIRRTIMTFENSGQDDTGFEATGSVPWAILRTIPTVPFDKIIVIITDDDGKAYEVQQFDDKKNKEYLQLWAMQSEVNRWSSICNSQAETAVVYSNYYELKSEEGIEYTSKPFYDKTNGLTEPWNFAIIPDHVVLQHGNDPEIKLWNRQGYIQFSPKLYTSVLLYKAGKVRYMYNEEPEIYAEPETEEWYPAIFQRSDIKASHYPTLDMKDQPDDLKIEKIEFKMFNATNAEEYQDWTDDNKPDYGRLKLRLTMKGDTKIYPILYLPSMLEHGKDIPVVRDFENCCLHYVDNNNEVVQTKVDIALDKTPLNISMPLRVWGNDEEYVELDAIQPTLIKEVYLDGRITKYLCEGETFILPYLLKDRISIHDFNREGHSEYECFNVGVLDEKGSTQKWRDWDEESSLKTKDETASIPEYIKLAYGIPKNNGNITKMLYWDYSEENPPKEVDLPFTDLKENSILFQDLRQINDNLDCIPPEKNDNLSSEDWDSAWDSVGKQEDNSKQDATLLHCYDIATKYKTYYFIFTPLLNMDSEKDFIKNICIPLKRRQNGSLSEEDMQNLMRCATECGLDWTKIYTKITNN